MILFPKLTDSVRRLSIMNCGHLTPDLKIILDQVDSLGDGQKVLYAFTYVGSGLFLTHGGKVYEVENHTEFKEDKVLSLVDGVIHLEDGSPATAVFEVEVLDIDRLTALYKEDLAEIKNIKDHIQVMIDPLIAMDFSFDHILLNSISGNTAVTVWYSVDHEPHGKVKFTFNKSVGYMGVVLQAVFPKIDIYVKQIL